MNDKYDTYTDLHISSYHELRNIAEFFYEESKKFDENDRQSDGYYFYAAAITFSTFMFEAWLNHAGYALDFDWDNSSDRTETISKFETIYRELGIKYDKSKEPYALVKKLFSSEFRHSIVHGKTLRKTVNQRGVTDPTKIMNRIIKNAYSNESEIKWTQCIKKDFALKVYEELKKIIHKIYEKIKEQNSQDYMKFSKAADLQHPEFPTTCVSSAIHKGSE